jgi:hypothetical protein
MFFGHHKFNNKSLLKGFSFFKILLITIHIMEIFCLLLFSFPINKPTIEIFEVEVDVQIITLKSLKKIETYE